MGCPWWQSGSFVSGKDIGEGNNGRVRGWDKFSLSQLMGNIIEVYAFLKGIRNRKQLLTIYLLRRTCAFTGKRQ